MESSQCKATATFSTIEQAEKAITAFNGYKLPQLGGSQIWLSHGIKAKFSILSSIYTAIATEIATEVARLQQSLPLNDFLKIKSYPSTDRNHRYIALAVISNKAKSVCMAKATVERLLRGHTASSGKGIIWNEFFMKPEGLSYLAKLSKEHDVVIYRNARKCILSLYGKDENKTLVESTLAKTVHDLAIETFVIDLDEKTPMTVNLTAYRKIVANLGKAAVRLEVTSTPKTIVVHGSAHDTNWAKKILQQISSQAVPSAPVLEDSAICAVCWCPVEETYTPACGHVYDLDCFVTQCLSCSEVPIKCLGSEGSCQSVISFANLEAALTRDQLGKLLQRSFTDHIRALPTKYQFCPMANCDQLYEVRKDGEVLTCSSCLTSVCATCGAISHEGLTCDEYRKAGLDDDAFLKWKKKNDARDCPKCGCTIQKSDGCNHMQCRICQAHICWTCMKVFDRDGETYAHMNEEHGRIFDDFGDDE